jgi:hypothetical protein
MFLEILFSAWICSKLFKNAGKPREYYTNPNPDSTKLTGLELYCHNLRKVGISEEAIEIWRQHHEKTNEETNEETNN